MIKLGELGGAGGIREQTQASGMTQIRQGGRLNTQKPPSPQREGAQRGGKSSNTPTQHSEMRKINLWIFWERALLCNFAAFLCLFSPKLHSLLPKDDILDPSGHNMTFSS